MEGENAILYVRVVNTLHGKNSSNRVVTQKIIRIFLPTIFRLMLLIDKRVKKTTEFGYLNITKKMVLEYEVTVEVTGSEVKDKKFSLPNSHVFSIY